MSSLEELVDHYGQEVLAMVSRTNAGRKILGNAIWWNISSITLRTALLATRGSSSLDRAVHTSMELSNEMRPWVPRNATVMEFGSGVGLNALALSKYCRQVIGIDISKRLIRIASKLARGVDKVTFIWYDGKRFPFAAQTLNFVFSVGVFERIPKSQVQGYLHEIARVLGTGGIAYLYFLSCRAANSDFTKRLGPQSYHYFTDEEAVSAVSNTGMKVIEVVSKPVAVILVASKPDANA